MNFLTEVLQLWQTSVEPLLHFNEALRDFLLGAWAKPCTVVLVQRQIACRQVPSPGDPADLSQHTALESLVVQASAANDNSSGFPTPPAARETKRLEIFGNRIVSSTSLALHSGNTTFSWAIRTTPCGIGLRKCWPWSRSNPDYGPGCS